MDHVFFSSGMFMNKKKTSEYAQEMSLSQIQSKELQEKEYWLPQV